jgi:hypothetical protein
MRELETCVNEGMGDWSFVSQFSGLFRDSEIQIGIVLLDLLSS